MMIIGEIWGCLKEAWSSENTLKLFFLIDAKYSKDVCLSSLPTMLPVATQHWDMLTEVRILFYHNTHNESKIFPARGEPKFQLVKTNTNENAR